MRFCYADPHYPGMAHLYKNHPDYAGEVDHKALIERLVAEFPDGWALSTNNKNLRFVLSMCPEATRTLAWCVPTQQPFPTLRIQRRWEPVFIHGGRPGYANESDYTVCNAPTGRERFPGMKPEGFCFWVFRCLGCLPGDEMVDLFPGSGAVGRAWEKYQRQMRLPEPGEKVKQLALS